MKRLLKLQNAIQPYAWGSHTAIGELMGHAVPTDNPEAELWMGAHPKAPSKVWYQGRWQGLDELIREDPAPLIGQAAVDRFGPQLPYLFKVLAVDQPLSIQAHPSKAMAEKGFARENEAGIALSAPHRNYRDDQHKPECVCALTIFHALCGFRSPQEMYALLSPLWPADRLDIIKDLEEDYDDGAIRPFFTRMMSLDRHAREALVAHIVSALPNVDKPHPAHAWVRRLNDAYPGDVGVLSPMMLNLIDLQPGQALYLPAGQLHAYLNGVAIELMANSDNVLRGGLTPKHVDVEELLRVLTFSAVSPKLLEPAGDDAQARVYPSQAEEFELSVLNVAPSAPVVFAQRPPIPEIWLCVEGRIDFKWPQSDRGLQIARGESVFVPAQVDRYEMHGAATLYKAGINPARLQAS